MISQLLLLASVAIKCSSLPTTVIDEPTVQYFMHHPNGTYNFDSYANTMSTFDDKYGSLFDSLSTEPINEEDYIFSEAEIAAHEALFKRDGRQSVILDMDDTQTLLVGTQQLPMYFSLFSDMTVIPADSLAECKGQVCYNAKTNDLLSNTGRSLSGFTNFASTNIFNPVDLTVSSTIQGNIQLDQFGLGAANIVVPAAAFFVLVTTGKATTNARVEFALSTSTYAPVTYLKVQEVQVNPAFLAMAVTSVFALFIGVSQNIAAQVVFTTHLRYGKPDISQYSGALQKFPVGNVVGKWSLVGGTVSVGTYTTTRTMQTLILDNQVNHILLPNAIVDEIYGQIYKAGKYSTKAQPGIPTTTLWGYPCLNPAFTIKFNFVANKVIYSYTLKGGLANVGPAWFGKGICEGTIQYSNRDGGGILGKPFYASVYTVFDYNSSGTGTTISLATLGSPR